MKNEKFGDNLSNRTTNDLMDELGNSLADMESYIAWINAQMRLSPCSKLEEIRKSAQLATQFTFDTLIELDEYKQEQEGENND